MTPLPRVLTLLAPDFEELEVVAPVDLMRRAGITVTLAALDSCLQVKGRNGLILQADTTLDEVINEAFECLFLPGGPGVNTLRKDERITPLIKRYSSKELWIVAICAAPLLLNDAGLLKEKTFTAHHSVKSELPDFLESKAVVIDGYIITSRGAGTAVQLGLSLIEHLVSLEKAKEIAFSISY